MSPYPQAHYTATVLPLENHAPRPRWQEWFSWAFVQAIASATGLTAQVQLIDANQVDIMIQTWGTYEGKVRTVAYNSSRPSSPNS